jgi:hypothetical protein
MTLQVGDKIRSKTAIRDDEWWTVSEVGTEDITLTSPPFPFSSFQGTIRVNLLSFDSNNVEIIQERQPSAAFKELFI